MNLKFFLIQILILQNLFTTSFAQQAVNNNLKIVNHRGANKIAPENTFAAGKKSVEYNVEYIEVDVRTSKDGVLYILHDPILNRTTNGKGFIKRKTSEYIDKLDAGGWFSDEFEGEKVPRLKDYLLWAKGKTKIYFDVKDADVKQLVDLVRECNMENDSFFWFRSNKKKLEFRKLAPEMNLKANAKSPKQILKAIEKFKVQIIESNLKHLNDDFLKTISENNLKLMLWGVNESIEGFKQIITHTSIDYINIDNIVLFQEVKNSFK